MADETTRRQDPPGVRTPPVARQGWRPNSVPLSDQILADNRRVEGSPWPAVLAALGLPRKAGKPQPTKAAAGCRWR